jgi:hypothetical protein
VVDRRAEALAQQRAVGQSREVVVQGHVAQAFLGTPALPDFALQLRGALDHAPFELLVRAPDGLLGELAIGNVLEVPDRAVHGPRGVDRLAGDAYPEGIAAAAPVDHLVGERLAAAECRVRHLSRLVRVLLGQKHPRVGWPRICPGP